MTVEYKNQLFRLAVVLYADNNYEVAPKTIHRKIIESALLSNDNKPINIHQIIDYIHEHYKIQFDEAEITSIIASDKEESFLVNQKNDDTILCLSEKRKLAIQSKISNKTIDYFICEFEKENEVLVTGSNIRELIYRFLYELLSTNISSFKKLLDNKRNIDELINVESNSYTQIEKEIINSFLIWDNNEKNKAIFDIASYALEYCMISNISGSSTFHLSTLKNKSFYLDTNVIFRVLGINGVNRQNRTKTFLKKFIEAGETLMISKFSEIEFKESIHFYIEKMQRYPVKKLNPTIFKEKYFQSLSNVFDFFHKWRIGKVNDSFDLFEAHILSLYEAFKNEFAIQVDYKIPFETTEEETGKFLTELASDIATFKTSEGTSHGYDSDYNDACNIHLVERRRDGKNTNLFEAKYFFISTDQTLRRWDYQRSNVTPIVILPSQWLSIVLRYVNRTSDDFKSFVSFLNLPYSENKIDGEKLHIILAGISEMTENFEQQSFLVNSIVQNKFEGILDKGTKDDEILEKTKSFAKTALQKSLEELSGMHSHLEDQFQKHKKITTGKIDSLEIKTNEQTQKLSAKEQEVIRLKSALKTKTVTEELSKWQNPAYFFLFIALLIIAFTLLQFCYKDWEYNFSYKIIIAIDSLESETQKNTLRTLMYSPLVGLWLIGVFCWNRLGSSEKKKNKINELNNTFDSIHN